MSPVPVSPIPPAPLLDLRAVVAIDAVARTRSFRLAAEALNTSQPTLSRLIASAEAALACPLFRRGWSGAETTARGDAVARTCRAIVAEIDTAQRLLTPFRAHMPALRLNLRTPHLQAIAAVTRDLSVSRSALALGRSQPELSRTLGDFSKRFGLDLFQRTPHGMTPQEPAHILTTLAGAIDFHLARLPQDLDRFSGVLTGRVSIGMLPFSGQDLIFRAFAHLTNAHPNIRLACVPGSYNALVEALRRREIDGMIGILRQADCPGGLRETPLYDEQFAVIARRDHPIHAAPASPEALARTQWIIAPHGTPLRRHFETVFAELGAAPPTQTCELLSFGSVEQMLVHSNSLAMLSYSARRLANLGPDLAEVKTPFPPVATPIGLTRLADAHADEAFAAFQTALIRIVQDAGSPAPGV